ncbi:hypothetical protein NPIL_337981 [Nephila pilipes]|uniref:Uncharacterized protein n=1 Tax=Nephila pilipes TaxID=299642 RepID=A0A8X6U4X7_NEPPI|nr:hypothetical protein NPIL_337981 [Nephila pilipes]
MLRQYSSNSAEDSDDESHDSVQQDKSKCVEIIDDVIHHRDFGCLNFDQATGKAIALDVLRVEIEASYEYFLLYSDAICIKFHEEIKELYNTNDIKVERRQRKRWNYEEKLQRNYGS